MTETVMSPATVNMLKHKNQAYLFLSAVFDFSVYA